MLDKQKDNRVNLTETVGPDASRLTQNSNSLDQSSEERKGGVNKCYTFCYLFFISIGMFQFGYAITSAGSVYQSFAYLQGWSNTNKEWYYKNYLTFLTTAINLGTITASLCAASLIKYGKWRMMFFSNTLILIGCVMSQFDNIWLILFARFIWGLGAGSFTVFVPKFINETAPTEYKGTFGAMSQFMCCLGIMTTALLGLYCPNYPEVNEYAIVDFQIAQYWRIIWGLPIFFACIQMIFMLCIFKYDTPVALKQKGDHDQLLSLMTKLYARDSVQVRLNELGESATGQKDAHVVGYKETFCDPVVRQAAWIGCAISAFQQLTGINVVIFYAGVIFSNTSLGANQANAVLMAVNLISATAASGFLGAFGRKPILVSTTIACSVCLFVTGIAQLKEWDTIELVMCCMFVAFFEFGPGPIVWLYMSEIMNDKGVSIGTVINMTLTLIIGIVSPYMISGMGGWAFIMFGAFQTAAAVILWMFMRETKGLLELEVQRLYRTDNAKTLYYDMKRSEVETAEQD